LVPLPVIFYQPETGLGFGATAVYMFEMGRSEEGTPSLPSTIAPVAIYTTKKQIIASLRADLYLDGGKRRLFGELAFLKFPTRFWGVGNDTPDALEEDYTPSAFGVLVEGQREFAAGWYFGVSGQYAYRALTDVEGGGLLDSGLVPGAADGDVVGLGALVSRDTRESVYFPRSSSYHQLRATIYNGFFGSDYDFLRVALDLRKYAPLFNTHVLALRALGVGTTSEAPFDLMPQLGGDVLLRGYFAGRFRDLDLLAFQAEYRAPLWWRIGGVVFAAAGQVQPELSAFHLGSFHPSAGFGLRFLLAPDEGVHLRADFAWGFDVESTGFYLSIGEAF
jgi:outer membrane protein assembly factor BamA